MLTKTILSLYKKVKLHPLAQCPSLLLSHAHSGCWEKSQNW